MPLGSKRRQLQSDLQQIFGNPDKPASGEALAKALSKFSKGILPPTIGIVTGIVPAALAYDTAPDMDKITGIENAINEFANFNALGMTPFAFTGIAPPPITGVRQIFDTVARFNRTTQEMAKALSYAILANYTLGRSVFTPLNIPIPTWNIPILPRAVRDEINQSEIDASIVRAQAQARDIAERELNGSLELDSFFEEMLQDQV